MQTTPLKADKKPSGRIHSLDEIRGLAVFCMVFYHAFYHMGESFGLPFGETLLNFFMPVQPFFAGIFIFISGISSRLSRNNLKRGLRLLAVAAAITLVTVVICPLIGLDGLQIYFGILHFLSVAMLIFSLVRPALDKLAAHWGILICALLYAFTAGISTGALSYGSLIVVNLPQALYGVDFLFPLGIYSNTFFSADYFPIFPHIFLFLAGSYVGTYAVRGEFPKALYKKRVPFFSWLGRHALIIYVAHQPIIFGVIYLVEYLIKR